MAASIYATPPPDLSSEDIALSDVSNTTLNNRNTTNSGTATTTNSNSNPVITDATITTDNKTLTTTAKTAEQPSSSSFSDLTPAHALVSPASESQLNKLKRSISAVLMQDRTGADETSSASDSTTTIADMAAANSVMQLQLLKAYTEAAKKRRKQNKPSRLGTLNLPSNKEHIGDANDEDELEGSKLVPSAEETLEQNRDSPMAIDYEEKLSKMYLPKSMEQLKQTFGLFQQQQHAHNDQIISTDGLQDLLIAKTEKLDEFEEVKEALEHERRRGLSADEEEVVENTHRLAIGTAQGEAEEEGLKNPYQTFCKECGENFENEFKLGLHMLHEHGRQENNSSGNQVEAESDSRAKDCSVTPLDNLSSVKVKQERPDYENSGEPPQPKGDMEGYGKGEQNVAGQGVVKEANWPLTSGISGTIGFTFPEATAAVALSAGGYLPLLGMPGFPSVDGINRPPLRIFNPEAYCDLCNKEFCNKYFLKTHKANKHGIYDPAMPPTSGEADGSASNLASSVGLVPASGTSHMLPIQLQQQPQQVFGSLDVHQVRAGPQPSVQESLGKQSTSPAGLTASSAPQPIYCDICSKRFTNVFAMRRHRNKVHEGQPAQQRNSPNDTQASPSNKDPSNSDSNADIFQLPDGFQQDFSLEQEELAFTPQPRKLSPQLQQQARDANFAHDKLKRLGVLNPESFCEICCKEYCNKYFLRTHKWKRHGIFVPTDDVKDDHMGQLAQKMSWPFLAMGVGMGNIGLAQGMPLNLMIVNEKGAVAQRFMEVASATPMINEQHSANGEISATSHNSPQMVKRIKQELSDEESSNKQNDEDQGNRSSAGGQQLHSMSSTPEPQKILGESLNSSSNPPSIPEATVGLQNLQKLQSMIQQLNDLNTKRPVPCHLCGKETENQYALHAHIMAEHGGTVDPGTAGSFLPLNFQQHLLQQQQQNSLKQSPSGSGSPGPVAVGSGSGSGSNSELRCQQCDRDFGSLQEFKQHINEVHLLPGSPMREGFVTPERPIAPANSSTSVGASAGTATNRPPYTITPTSSYCEICNKELCNKYFMKTHMQRMHGIEIENGAQIGGVVCNICNKELCSKYFLRVHKHNTHGIIEEGAPLPQPRQNGGLNFEQQQQQQQQQACGSESDQSQRGHNSSPFGSSAEAKTESPSDSRYYANYTEVCSLCGRRFRSPKWLRAHLMGDHGTAGIEKLRELEQQAYSAGGGSASKSNSPTLKIPNGAQAAAAVAAAAAAVNNNLASMLPNPANLAQALQNLNANHLFGNMPKNVLPGIFGTVADQALQTPRFKEYQCSMCPFTTPYYAFLYIHERSHSLLNNGSMTGSVALEGDPHPQSADTSAQDEKVVIVPPAPSSKGQLRHKIRSPLQHGDKLATHQNHNFSTANDTVNNNNNSSNNNNNNDKKINNSGEPKNLSLRAVSGTPPTPYINLTRSPIPPVHHHHKHTAIQQNSNSSIYNIKEEFSRPPTAEAESHFSHQTRSTSPVSGSIKLGLLPQVLLTEIANKLGKPASYAVPKDNYNVGDQQMQAFVVEAQQNGSLGAEGELDKVGSGKSNGIVSEEASNRFVPAIIYLPVKERVSGPITVSFNLTPA